MGKKHSKIKKKTIENKNDVPNDRYQPTRMQHSTPQLPSKPLPVEKPNFQALFEYDKTGTEDISMRKEDPLFVLNKELVLKQQSTT
jgi:hypothetical protein